MAPSLALPPTRAAEISPTHWSTSSGLGAEPDGANQRDDVTGHRPAVLLISTDLHPPLLGRQPHHLQKLGHRVGIPTGSAPAAAFW